MTNNLLNSQKFVFPAHEEDEKLKANLRKATKLTYEVLHPGHNKQNVNLALAIFHDTTIAAIKSYFPS